MFYSLLMIMSKLKETPVLPSNAATDQDTEVIEAQLHHETVAALGILGEDPVAAAIKILENDA